MKKLYNFRLDPILVKDLDKLEGSRTYNVTNAISCYLQNGDSPSSVDKDIVKIFKDQIEFLRGQVTYLQKENSYLSKGWFHRLLLPKP